MEGSRFGEIRSGGGCGKALRKGPTPREDVRVVASCTAWHGGEYVKVGGSPVKSWVRSNDGDGALNQ